MKKLLLIFSAACLFMVPKVQAQYDTTTSWGVKYVYNGSDYPGSFLKLKIAVANPRISGTGGQVVFYDSETSQFNQIQVKGVSQVSDARQKTNITNLNKGLGTILNLRPVSFNWKNETMNTRSAGGETTKSIGFLAQEVAQYMPEIVTLSSTGDSLVDYTAIIPVLVQAIKEQNTTIQLLESELSELSSKVDASDNVTATRTALLSEAVLNQNTPNPFDATTTISFTVPTSARTAFISVCNLQGTQVKKYTIASRGEGSLILSTSELGLPGMYMYSLIVDGKLIDTKRMYVMD